MADIERAIDLKALAELDANTLSDNSGDGSGQLTDCIRCLMSRQSTGQHLLSLRCKERGNDLMAPGRDQMARSEQEFAKKHPDRYRDMLQNR